MSHQRITVFICVFLFFSTLLSFSSYSASLGLQRPMFSFLLQDSCSKSLILRSTAGLECLFYLSLGAVAVRPVIKLLGNHLFVSSFPRSQRLCSFACPQLLTFWKECAAHCLSQTCNQTGSPNCILHHNHSSQGAGPPSMPTIKSSMQSSHSHSH